MNASHQHWRTLWGVAFFVVGMGLLGSASTVYAEGGPTLSFEADVRPILKAYCLDGHGGDEKLEGKLDLRLAKFAIRGGETGTALVPGDVEKSPLIARMVAGEMPPSEKKVPAEKIEVVKAWVLQGAKTLREEPEQLPAGIDITPEERSYWFFQPLVQPAPPAVSAVPAGSAPVRTPIDAFLMAELAKSQIGFAPDADRRTFLRRVAFDLTGLPPSEQQLQAFLADASEQAFEKAVDQLLDSPQYGERWGRHWLDVAGYADSEGNGSDDTPRKYAYKYRDYIIRSLNADKPLPQFITEQLAGDELVPQPWSNLSASQIELLAATGFLRTAADPTSSGGFDPVLGGNQMVTDTLKIVGSSLMGLTVGCAQCHDHRYDPIPQADYFRLRAVFEPALDPNHWRRPSERLVSLATDADRAKSAAIEAEAQALQNQYNEKVTRVVDAIREKEILKFPAEQQEPLRVAFSTPADKRTPEQKQLVDLNPKVNISPGVIYQFDEAMDKELKADQAKIAAKRAEKPVEDFVSPISELPGALPETKIFHRGDYRQPLKAVQPGDLTIAAADGKRLEIAAKDPSVASSGRRLAFAKHITSGEHPLFGRVMANRIWLHHFGKGLVDTPGDFGMLGTRPTHPALLDWLAAELPKQGWSLKKMHKLIVLSSVYRQASSRHGLPDAAMVQADPENRLYSRFPLVRHDAEILRDRMLSAAGKLDLTPFGPAVPVTEDFFGQAITPEDQPRRSVYLEMRRSKPISFLATFDAPAMVVNCDRRTNSAGAPQALLLMNNDFVLKQAGNMANRLRTEALPALPDSLQPLAAQYPRQADAWQYGYGGFDDATKRVVGFEKVNHFTGSIWQGGAALPDPVAGYVLLHAAGGHAGNDASHATIRRWIAPQSGVLTVSGPLKRPAPNGDGVRGRIVSSRQGLVGEWQVMTGEVATGAEKIEVQAGDTIDFAVDCVASVESDSFEWSVRLVLKPTPESPALYWNSSKDFHGPLQGTLPQQVIQAWKLAFQREPSQEELTAACQFVFGQMQDMRTSEEAGDLELQALTNLCQQLLSSNEFLYGE